MGLELIISRYEYEKTPLEVSVNLKDKKLHIANHNIFMGEYLNVAGPQERYDKLLLSLVYLNNRSYFVKKCAEKIRDISILKVEIKENSSQQEVYILDLYFPRNAHIIVATYNVQKG